MEAREAMAKPGIEAMEREFMVRKKRIIEAGGRRKSPRKEEDSPGVTEEVLYPDEDAGDATAAGSGLHDQEASGGPEPHSVQTWSPASTPPPIPTGRKPQGQPVATALAGQPVAPAAAPTALAGQPVATAAAAPTAQALAGQPVATAKATARSPVRRIP